jgi:hypothetical protein
MNRHFAKPGGINGRTERSALAEAIQTLFLAALGASTLLLAGCAFHKSAIVTAPVGPPPQGTSTNGPTGTLVVYSARDPHCDVKELPYLCPHTDYAIYSSTGALVQKVHNSTDAVIEWPANIQLPEGSYRVETQASSCQKVTVPVVIQAGRVTTVHLQPSPSVQSDVALVQSNPVRLPTGVIVGWRADVEPPTKP